MNLIVCASPTCRAQITISIPSHLHTRRSMHTLAVNRGWAIEQHPGDDKPEPYCERCKESG